MHIFKIGAYVKLAKLWEKHADAAIPMHHQYFERKYNGVKDSELVDVYIDITGKKHIYQRKAMVQLLSDCKDGRVNTIERYMSLFKEIFPDECGIEGSG